MNSSEKLISEVGGQASSPTGYEFPSPREVDAFADSGCDLTSRRPDRRAPEIADGANHDYELGRPPKAMFPEGGREAPQMKSNPFEDRKFVAMLAQLKSNCLQEYLALWLVIGTELKSSEISNVQWANIQEREGGYLVVKGEICGRIIEAEIHQRAAAELRPFLQSSSGLILATGSRKNFGRPRVPLTTWRRNIMWHLGWEGRSIDELKSWLQPRPGRIVLRTRSRAKPNTASPGALAPSKPAYATQNQASRADAQPALPRDANEDDKSGPPTPTKPPASRFKLQIPLRSHHLVGTVAKMLCVSPRYVKEQIKAGNLTGYRLGNKIIVDVGSVSTFLDKRRMGFQ